MVDDGSDAEEHLLIIAAVLVVAYSALSLTNIGCGLHHLVFSRSLLGLVGVAIAALATAAGFGLANWFRLSMNPVSINLVPFLSFAIGVDDMFVLAHNLKWANFNPSPPGKTKAQAVQEKMTLALSRAGPSITTTSLANLLAFGIAAATPMPAVRAVMLQMVISVLVNWVALLLMFTPCMLLDTWWVINWSWPLNKCMKEEPKSVSEVAAAEQRLSTHSRFITLYHRVLSKSSVMIAVVILFFCLWVTLFVVGVLLHERGLRLSDIALRGTYQRDYALIQEDHFPIYSSYLVTRSSDFSSVDAQDVLHQTMNIAQTSKHLLEGFNVSSSSWQTAFWAGTGANMQAAPIPWGDVEPYDGVSPYPGYDFKFGSVSIFRLPFYNNGSDAGAFNLWAATSGVFFLNNLVCIDNESGQRAVSCASGALSGGTMQIAASKVTVATSGHFDDEDTISIIEDMRSLVDPVNDIISTPEWDTFIFGYPFKVLCFCSLQLHVVLHVLSALLSCARSHAIARF